MTFLSFVDVFYFAIARLVVPYLFMPCLFLPFAYLYFSLAPLPLSSLCSHCAFFLFFRVNGLIITVSEDFLCVLPSSSFFAFAFVDLLVLFFIIIGPFLDHLTACPRSASGPKATLETIWPTHPQNSPTLPMRMPDQRATSTGLGCSDLIRFHQ